MPKTYPPEVRQRARELNAQGLNAYEIADVMGLAQPTVYRWLHPDKEAAYREQKLHAVCPECGGPMRTGAAHCRSCKDRTGVRDDVVERWYAGHSAWTIGMAHGRTPEWAMQYIQVLKKRGYLPRLGGPR